MRRRLVPLAGLAVAALAVGIVLGSSHTDPARQLVRSYVQDWARHDYSHMYAMLDGSSRSELTLSQFTAAYEKAARTATMVAIVPGRLGNARGDVLPAAMVVRTRIFGTIRQPLLVPIDRSGSQPLIRFSSTLLFPGLQSGEALTRSVSLPPRGAILARDGTPLAKGPNRTSPIPSVASEVVGVLEPVPPDEQDFYEARGYPPGAQVGKDGLERIFELKLAGTPGGTLRAGSRVLAQSSPQPGSDVTTTIDPSLEQAAITAIAGRYAGIAAMDPRTGAVLALAGVAFSALQPPGSTMKIITTTAALDAGIVKISDTFPIMTAADIDGFILHNASGEACGGTLLNAFAVSCNSVFAPLGAKLGGARLVAMAERFGFNQPPPFPGAAESTIPPANKIGGSLDVASSAIGQGQVQASALEMTDAGATIAMGGRRPIPTLLANQPPKFAHVTSPRVAGLVQRMMIAVVQFGTGTAAQIPGVTVAGKTGTAELGNTSGSANAASETDAWFVGYAPVGSPKIVVGALFPNAGAGGQTAAPPVHDVIVAGLHIH